MAKLSEITKELQGKKHMRRLPKEDLEKLAANIRTVNSLALNNRRLYKRNGRMRYTTLEQYLP